MHAGWISVWVAGIAKKPDGPCGNQHYSRELLMMGIEVPETY